MNVGQLYEITLGERSDKYVCIRESPSGWQFKRMGMPKTKIDGVRLPESILISPSYNVVQNKISTLKSK